METVGFIGLGRMGSAMVRNIQNAGYPMVVHDARKEATGPFVEEGARLAGSPAEVARLSDVTFTSLPGPEEAREVVTGPGGILEGIKEGSIYLDLSTCGPAFAREIEPMFHERGAHVLDTPVLGSPTVAIAKNLIVMVGGEQKIYERVTPILDAFANKVVYAGGLGTASVCKLVHNMMASTVRQVIAEGLTLGVSAGVGLEALLESGSRGVLGQRTGMLSQTVFRGQFEPPNFTLAGSLKDLELATELARAHNVPMPMANLAEQIMIQGMNRGWADKDFNITFLLQEEAAGVQVRS